MKTPSNITIDIDILTRYLAGEATPDEAMAIDDWLMVSAENAAFFAQLSQAWHAAGESNYQRPDIAARWQQFMQRPVVAALPQKKRAFPMFKTAAAAIVLIALLTAGILLFRNGATPALPAMVFIQTQANLDTVLLSDHTSIVLCPHTTVSHPPMFNGTAREVTVNGKAFFKVAARVQQPFRIDLKDITLEVIGTAFEVNNTASDSVITVMVTEGAVKLYNRNDTLIVRAEQTGTYHKLHKKFEWKEGINNNALGYTTRSFDFNDLPLQEIAGYLESAYQVNIRFMQPGIAQCRLSTSFDQQSLTYILDIIAATLNVTYTITGNQVDISGNGCN